MGSMEKWLSLSKGEGRPFDLRDPDFDTLSGEPLHTAIGGAMGLISKRNPYVFVATGLVHGGYHFYHKFVSGSSSQSYQQNGGPGNKSSYKPSGHTPTLGARSVSSAHGGRRSGSKPRKRCPPGHFWNGRRCVEIPEVTAYDKRFIKKWSEKR